MMRANAIFAILIICFAMPARAATYYVAPNGSDSRTPAQAQSSTTPWASITRASKAVQPGDTVRIAAGQFPSTYAAITASGTKSKPITFVGDNPKPRLTAYAGSTLSITHSRYVVVDNLDITNDDHRPNTKDGGNGIAIDGGSAHITIEHCTVHDCAGGGIGTGNNVDKLGCDYITIKNNLIYNNAWYAVYQCSGISLWMNQNADPSDSGIHNYVVGNICHDNSGKFITDPASHTDGNGIIVDVGYSHSPDQSGTPSPDAKTYVAYNTCYNNGGAGVHSYLNDNVVFDHNTCYHNCQDPHYSGGGEISIVSCTGCRAIGNIAVSTGSTVDKCVCLWQAPDVVISGNDFFGGALDCPADGNVVSDPAFKNAGGDPPSFDVKKGGPGTSKAGVLGAWASY